MILLRCDRCGKERVVTDFLDQFKPHIAPPSECCTDTASTKTNSVIPPLSILYGTRQLHLCDECRKDFFVFMNGLDI